MVASQQWLSFFFTLNKGDTVDANELGKMFYEHLDRAGIEIFDNGIAEVPWDECTQEYKEMMILAAKNVVEELYGNGWRLVRIEHKLGTDRVCDEFCRVPPWKDD